MLEKRPSSKVVLYKSLLTNKRSISKFSRLFRLIIVQKGSPKEGLVTDRNRLATANNYKSIQRIE